MKKIVTAVMLIALSTGNVVFAKPVVNSMLISFQEKQYKEIPVAEVPVAITKELTEKYPGYNITKAFVSEDKEYKLQLTDGKAPVTVFYTATGEFVKEQKI